MFLTNDKGVNCIMFGTGDIDVSAGLMDLLDDTIGIVALTPRKPSAIGTKSKRDECMLDTDIGVHTRLMFSRTESIDVLIEYLEEAKRCMNADKQSL